MLPITIPAAILLRLSFFELSFFSFVLVLVWFWQGVHLWDCISGMGFMCTDSIPHHRIRGVIVGKGNEHHIIIVAGSHHKGQTTNVFALISIIRMGRGKVKTDWHSFWHISTRDGNISGVVRFVSKATFCLTLHYTQSWCLSSFFSGRRLI